MLCWSKHISHPISHPISSQQQFHQLAMSACNAQLLLFCPPALHVPVFFFFPFFCFVVFSPQVMALRMAFSSSYFCRLNLGKDWQLHAGEPASSPPGERKGGLF